MDGGDVPHCPDVIKLTLQVVLCIKQHRIELTHGSIQLVFFGHRQYQLILRQTFDRDLVICISISLSLLCYVECSNICGLHLIHVIFNSGLFLELAMEPGYLIFQITVYSLRTMERYI